MDHSDGPSSPSNAVSLLFHDGDDQRLVSLPPEGYRLIGGLAFLAREPPGRIFPAEYITTRITWDQFAPVAAHVQEIIDNGRLGEIYEFYREREAGGDVFKSLAPNTMEGMDFERLAEFAETTDFLGYTVGCEDAMGRMAGLVAGKSEEELAELFGTACDLDIDCLLEIGSR